MGWNIVSAVSYLQWHAAPRSTGHCARYVREAIERGGIKLMRTEAASDYGPELQAAGFYKVSGGNPRRGDVVVIKPIAKHPYGHMAMYDGQIWISDFQAISRLLSQSVISYRGT